MDHGVSDPCCIEPLISLNGRRFELGQSGFERADSAQAGEIQAGEQPLAQWVDDQGVDSVWTVRGEERGQPCPKGRGRARTTDGKTGPVAKAETNYFIASAAYLDQVGADQGVGMGENRHRSRLTTNTLVKLLIFVIAVGLNPGEQTVYPGGLRPRLEMAAWTRRLGPIAMATAQPLRGKG
jgi:hypothetical protein